MNGRRPSSMEQEWLGLRQVAQYASLSDRTLRTWIHDPIDPLRAVRVGGKILIKKSDLNLWLERRHVKPLEAVDLDGIVKSVLQGLGDGH